MFGDKAKTAVTEELQQLHDQEAFQPVHPRYLFHEEHKKHAQIFNTPEVKERWTSERQSVCGW